ncbi:SusC/RagA family TonB-linked outer membrane protein [Reichenbachiella sp. MALMAid0571]|uniref:SusC/RagA family TonB-linked outer membrane protein n=1 Tax=Reichenbachiella sp. MALMAid0571 TaxID=3143939 RepID=UPI0032DF722E
MKFKLVQIIIMLSKYAVFGFLMQVLFFNLMLAENANGQKNVSVKEVEIALHVENLTISKLFKEIERKTKFRFSVDQLELKSELKNKVTFLDQKIKVSDVLIEVSKQSGIMFKQVNNNINVRKIDHEQNEQIEALQILQMEVEVTGKVTDENGEGLPGASVVVKGTSVGTTTDLNGNYKLSVPEQSILTISFVGYKTSELLVDTQSVIDVQMELDAEELETVVITAFGIEKQKKSLSYSVQEVEGKRLSSVGNTNLVNSIQGKVAGVTVKQSSGAPGSRSQITIRGSRSFTGNNEPLYVIDGLPIASGGRIIDINPNDIKSVNVLKGPTAAALYGLRASNGVIIIETKKGENAMHGKPAISFETSYNFDRVSRFPDTQMTYGQGTDGQFNAFSPHSWGARIDQMGTYTNQLGEQEVAAVYDNDKDLFKTGKTLNSNLTISNTFDRGNYAINIGIADQSGTLKNTGLQRNNVKFAGGYSLSDKLKVNTSMSYANNVVNSAVVPWWATFSVPASYNLKGNPTHVPGEPYRQINYRGSHDNFYWALDNNSDVEKTSRTFGSISFDYKPLDWITIKYLIGLDEYTTISDVVNELGSSAGRTNPPSGGSISNSMSNQKQINSNLSATLSKKIGEDINIDLMIGNETYDIRSNRISSTGSDIVIGGFHHISNTGVQSTGTGSTNRRVVGFFSNLSVSWKNSLFLNASGRNDIVSNMPSQNRSFFYPSVGASVVFTEFLSIPENVLTFGKFRASVAEVGQAGPTHSTETVFVSGNAAGSFNFPYQGLSAFTQSNQLNSSDLQPENTRTYELGVDLRFLDNRIGLDYTYYDTKANGQIYSVPIAVSTGFSSELRNAGEMSIQGHEITLNIKPVETTTLLWDVAVNFSTYTNKVLSLAEGIEELQLGQGFRVSAVALVGEQFPALKGIGYARDPESGEVVVDGRQNLPNGSVNPFYGMPLRTTGQINLGTSKPDFEINIFNSFSFKNFSFSAQLDWLQGGVLSSGYTRLGRLYGVLSETENREEDYVFPGKKGYYSGGELIVEGDNEIIIKRGYDFYGRNQDPINESNMFSGTYVRLREVKLSYDFPGKWLENTFLGSVSFYLVGRNLWLNSALPHFDPEMFNTSSGESYNSYPQNKSFGGGIRVNF